MVKLDVPFKDNATVKSLGAIFNPKNKTWYVPDGINPYPFKEWFHKRSHEEKVYSAKVKYAKAHGLPLPKKPNVNKNALATVNKQVRKRPRHARPDEMLLPCQAGKRW